MDFNQVMESGKEKALAWNDGRIKRSTETRITFVPKTNKRKVTKSLFSDITLYQQTDGRIYFDKNESLMFEFVSFNWDGPQYDAVTRTTAVEKSKGKTKRKGRVAGALVGSLILPGVGTAVGALVGTGNKKTSGKTVANTETCTTRVEIPTMASLVLRNMDTGEIVHLDFECTSELGLQFSQLQKIEHTLPPLPDLPAPAAAPEPGDPYEELKRLKELLDMEIITPEEFDAQKAKLLKLM